MYRQAINQSWEISCKFTKKRLNFNFMVDVRYLEISILI